jgi:predicted NBD/HSP70 family sugar kinase
MGQNKQNSIAISNRNIFQLLGLIWQNKTVSRANLAKLTGLSAPTVSRIVDRLINVEGLVIDEGVCKPTQGRGGGRPPNQLAFRGQDSFLVGVELGFSQMQVVATDLYAKEYARRVEPTRAEKGFDQAMRRANELILGVLKDAGIAPGRVCGIGIALTGLLGDHTSFATQPAPPKSTEFPLQLRFPWGEDHVCWDMKGLHGLPVFFSNMAHSTASGELWLGQGRRFSEFICVNLRRESLVTGIVIGGRPISGLASHGGGIGHLTMQKESELVCLCGNRGCLEALIAAGGLEYAARQRLGKGVDSLLRGMCDGDPARLTESMIYRAAREKDPLACELLDEAAEYIGLGIAGSINLFHPQAIFLGGSQIAEAGEAFFERIRRTALSRAIEIMARDVQFLPMRLGSDGALLGAVSLVLEQVLNLRIPLPTRHQPIA